MTNGEYIRNLTDGELAKIIIDNDIVSFCPEKEECIEKLNCFEKIEDEKCYICALEWLNKNTKWL